MNKSMIRNCILTLPCLMLLLVCDQAEEIKSAQWRAFWVDAFGPGFRTPAEVDALINDIQSLKMNTIFAQMRKRGDAYYRKTTVAPFTEDPLVPKDFDPFEYLLKKAHAAGIQVHAWVNAMTLWKNQEQKPRAENHLFHTHGFKVKEEDNWLNCDDKGAVIFPVGYFLDPGHPAVGEHLAQVVTEIISNYPVDGIHLDYIRYPETSEDTNNPTRGVGYNAVSVRRFNELHKKTGKPSINDPVWNAWRREQVTSVVMRIKQAIVTHKPNVIYSAALIPWGDGPLTEEGWSKSAPYIRVFQDWHHWRREGLLDVTIPMNYDRETNPKHAEFFNNWIAFEKRYRYRSKLIIGIGSYLNSLEDTIAQTRRALAPLDGHPGPEGICYFNYSSFKNAQKGKPALDDLRRALTSDGAPFSQAVKP